jgi:hypothetical protein
MQTLHALRSHCDLNSKIIPGAREIKQLSKTNIKHRRKTIRKLEKHRSEGWVPP